jgi:hypothetical protein
LRDERNSFTDIASRRRMRRRQQKKTCLADDLFGTDITRWIAGIGITVRWHSFNGLSGNV